jgi:hypothetical protein
MVIGAFMGAAVWRVFEPIVPSMGHNPAPYVIIGMMCCFGGISRAPLAVMLMVAEMTGSLSMLAPAMLAVGLAWLIVRRSDDTIYRTQLKNRAEAPAQQLLAGLPLLAVVPTSRALARPRLVLQEWLGTDEARLALEDAHVSGAPVVDEAGRFEGVLARSSLAAHDARDRTAGDLADSGAPTVSTSSCLDSALESLMDSPLSWVSVLDADRHIVGTLSISDLLTAYRRELLASVASVGGLGPELGAIEVEIRDDSPAVGRKLRAIGLRRGVLVTSIARGGEVVLPSGDTVVLAGDRLFVLGKIDDMTGIGTVTSARGTAA